MMRLIDLIKHCATHHLKISLEESGLFASEKKKDFALKIA